MLDRILGIRNAAVFAATKLMLRRDNSEQQEEMLREDISERHMFEILRLPMCEILIKGHRIRSMKSTHGNVSYFDIDNTKR